MSAACPWPGGSGNSPLRPVCPRFSQRCSYRLFPAALSHPDLHKTGSLESGKEDKPACLPTTMLEKACPLPPPSPPLHPSPEPRPEPLRLPDLAKSAAPVQGTPVWHSRGILGPVTILAVLSDHRGDSDDSGLGSAKLRRRGRCSLGPQASQIRKGPRTPR